MTNISKRHHYLPNFFIKGFINPSKQVWVFDKKADKILKTPKSPKSIFYEWNKYTLTVDGRKSDILEKYAYKYHEDIISKQFAKIQSKPINEIENQELVNHIYLMAVLTYYRTPATEKWTNQITQNNLKKDLPTFVLDQINNIYDLQLNETDRKKFIDSIAPFLNFTMINDRGTKEEGYYKIIEASKTCFLLSDNPVIYRKPPQDYNDLTNTLIFPLTSRRVFYGLKESHYSFNNEIIKMINNLLTIQAKQYFASENKTILELYVNEFKTITPFQEQFQKLAKELFNIIKQ